MTVSCFIRQLEHLVTVASKNTVELQLFACYFRLFYGGNVTEGDGIAYVVKVVSGLLYSMYYSYPGPKNR